MRRAEVKMQEKTNWKTDMSVFQKRFLMSESWTFRDSAAVKTACPRRPRGRSIQGQSFFCVFVERDDAEVHKTAKK